MKFRLLPRAEKVGHRTKVIQFCSFAILVFLLDSGIESQESFLKGHFKMPGKMAIRPRAA
jgi:hypothetical protein